MASTSSLTGLHDIFYHILSHIIPDPKVPTIGVKETSESKSARKALACLARTHSSFTQPALTEMWRSLPSEQPLEHLLCVVGIAQRRPTGQWDRPALEMCGSPTTHGSDWLRFQGYASLVREIIIDPSGCSWDITVALLEDTFWCQLFAAFGHTPVLPCLESATFRTTKLYRYIDTGPFRLLNPAIREFIVDFPHAPGMDFQHLGKAITVCFSSMQNLEVLSLQVPFLTPFLDMETLPQLHPRLRSVKLHRGAPIKLSSLPPLATLLNLEYLSIRLLLCDQELPNLSIPFPGLRHLAVSGGDFAIIGVLLDHVDVPKLRCFSLYETHEDSNNMAEDLSSHLRKLITNCPCLTAFEWFSKQAGARRIGYRGQRLSRAPLAEILSPLLSHRAMRSFSASFLGPIVPYTPTDFRTIAEAWPDLERFYLYDQTASNRTWPAERYANLESIMSFARYCPGLRSLEVHIPTVQFDPSSALASELAHSTPAPHWLHELSVDRVTGPGEEDRGCSQEDAVQFRALMEKLFRTAAIPRLRRRVIQLAAEEY